MPFQSGIDTLDPMLREFRTLLPYLKKYRFNYVLRPCLPGDRGRGPAAHPAVRPAGVDDLSLGRTDSIPRLALYIVGVAAVVASGRFLWRYFLHGSARRIEVELRDRFFDHFMVLPSDFYQRNKIGDLMARSTNDLHAIRMASSMGLVTFVDGVFMSGAILVIMMARNPRVSLYTILPLVPITVLILVFGKMVGARFKRVQELYSRLSDVVQETMTGIRVVKSFVKEDVFAARFSAANDEYRDSSMGLAKIFGFFFPFIAFLSGLTTLILLWAGGEGRDREPHESGGHHGPAGLPGDADLADDRGGIHREHDPAGSHLPEAGQRHPGRKARSRRQAGHDLETVRGLPGVPG